MGRTKASRLGKSVPEPSASSDDLTLLEVVFFLTSLFHYRSSVDVPSASSNPQIHEHAPPLQAEAGDEFVEKLVAQGQKNKAPASDAGSSQAPASKRFRTEPLAGKVAGVRRYKRKQMPTSSG
jgi:hypothetical protein